MAKARFTMKEYQKERETTRERNQRLHDKVTDLTIRLDSARGELHRWQIRAAEAELEVTALEEELRDLQERFSGEKAYTADRNREADIESRVNEGIVKVLKMILRGTHHPSTRDWDHWLDFLDGLEIKRDIAPLILNKIGQDSSTFFFS